MVLSRSCAPALVLFSLLAACAPSIEPLPAAAACVECGAADGAHVDYATWSATEQRRLPGVPAPGFASAQPSSRVPRNVCPLSFGALPAEGRARMVRVDEARDETSRSVRWALVSARALTRPMLEPLRARLGGLGESGDRVWFLTLTVRAARASNGRPAGRVDLALESGRGGGAVSSGVAAWAATDVDLDALVFPPEPSSDVALPAVVALANVDGNCIELLLGADTPRAPDAVRDESEFRRLPWLGQLRELARKGERAPTELFP